MPNRSRGAQEIDESGLYGRAAVHQHDVLRAECGEAFARQRAPEQLGVAALLVRGKRKPRAYLTVEFSGEIRAGILERVSNRRASQRKSRSRDHRNQAHFHSCAAGKLSREDSSMT